MRIDELEVTLDALEREGRRPKFLYTVPSFQNPAGVTMSLERRHALVRIARERELLIMEDNPYGMLRYEGEPLPTLYSLDDEFVIYTGTFSKILSPGVRLGWAVAPAPILDQMQSGKQGTDLCSSPITQYFVAAYFDSGPWGDYLGSLVEIYRRRRDVMLDAMAEHFPREAQWTHPQGGLFIWATLPDYIDTTDLLARALRQNVAFVPGRAAYLDGRGGSSMRLNFSGVAEDQIREGIRRIGAIATEQVAMYGTLSGAGRPSKRGAASQPPDGEPLAPGGADAPGSAPRELTRRDRPYSSEAKSSGVTWSRKSLNFSTTSSVSSTSCSNSMADSVMTSSAAKIGAPERTASASASDGRESISRSRPLARRLIDA